MTTLLATTFASVAPIGIDNVRAARERIRSFLEPTPLRTYGTLDQAVGNGVTLLVKHENFQPTGAFKIRNALAFMTALPADQRALGVVAATRGNHGLGVAWAAREFGVRATICVPHGNNPEKNAGMRALGADLVENGLDFDDALEIAARLATESGAAMVHSTNDLQVLAGAATLTLELVEQAPRLDALVLAVGGGSHAVGALVVTKALAPHVRVYAVQASGAATAQRAWHGDEPTTLTRPETFADGIATRGIYPVTFPALRAGLTDFITVTDAEIADAMRLLLGTTHSLVEGAAAAGLAGVRALGDQLAGQRVGIVLSGGNVDAETLARVVSRSL